MSIADRMNELGIELPRAPAPVGAYVPYVISGSLMFISGQVPIRDGKMIHEGKVPLDVTVEQGQECAALCFLNAIAQAKAALGDLDQVERIVRMTGYVAVADDFTDQPPRRERGVQSGRRYFRGPGQARQSGGGGGGTSPRSARGARGNTRGQVGL